MFCFLLQEINYFILIDMSIPDCLFNEDFRPLSLSPYKVLDGLLKRDKIICFLHFKTIFKSFLSFDLPETSIKDFIGCKED